MYIDGAYRMSIDDYEYRTWYLFKLFLQFWKLFRNKKGVLLLTGENKKNFERLVRALRECTEKEIRVDMFETLNVMMQVLILYEEEAFMHKVMTGEELNTELLTELVLTCKPIIDICEDYQLECIKVENDENYETIFYTILKHQIIKVKGFARNKFHEEFSNHLDDILDQFK